MTDADKIINPLHNLPDNLPDWASPGNWLGPEGHAGFKKPVDDESLCNLCSFPLKMFNDEAETMSSLNVFHLLTTLSEKKCCPRSAITRFLCNFRRFIMTEFKKCTEPDSWQTSGDPDHFWLRVWPWRRFALSEQSIFKDQILHKHISEEPDLLSRQATQSSTIPPCIVIGLRPDEALTAMYYGITVETVSFLHPPITHNAYLYERNG